MANEELSQDDIDSLLNGDGEAEQDDSKEDLDEDSQDDESINSALSQFAEHMNTSLEDVLKTVFSLEIVSKFTDLSTKKVDELSFEDGVFLSSKINIDSKSANFVVYIKKEFASILSDLMLMGPGEAKEQLEPDDLDAVKEMLSQVFGSFQTAYKEVIGKSVSLEINDVKEESPQLEGGAFYYMEFDVALPNIKNDTIVFFAKKEDVDSVFEDDDTSEGDVPFEDVEKIEGDNSAVESTRKLSKTPDNLDIILDVDLDVKIRIGEKHILIKDLLDLREGSIIELEKNIDEPMDILINNKVVARGVVVVVGGRFGVKITNIDTKEERIKSLGE